MIFSISEIKSILIGAKKGRRDVVRVKQHKIDHQIRHEADPAYSCFKDEHEFWDHLGEDMAEEDAFAKAGYAHVVDRYKRKWLKQHPEPERPKIIPGLRSIPIEMAGIGSMDDLVERLGQALMNQVAFSDLVSETGLDDPDIAAPTGTTEEGK
jgi:hypothetical protein